MFYKKIVTDPVLLFCYSIDTDNPGLKRQPNLLFVSYSNQQDTRFPMHFNLFHTTHRVLFVTSDTERKGYSATCATRTCPFKKMHHFVINISSKVNQPHNT